MRSNQLSPANMHAGPNMTPLVDVVMVILIFLMLAGSFASSEHFIVAKDSPIVNTFPPKPNEPAIGEQKPQLQIHVRQSELGADVMELSGGVTVSTSEALLSKLNERRAEYAEAGRADDVEVIIYPMAETSWAPLMSTYDAALRAKFKTVRFAMVASR